MLKAIASLGRGSLRSIGSGQTAISVAMELLNEMAQPGLRDLKIQFKGIDVAAVYPEQLPNLSAGMQQILVGRYLPKGEDQQGEIIVTGTRNGEPVKYSARVSFKDAEKGNSFIPRLWARAHLEQLLQQGTSDFIKDEIIGLSEEFHIMTPYTSLLVLETDEDRKRFGVKRRFEMRDGERFFADGRDAVNYELLQKVIREAGNWRLQLRQQVLEELALLGRDKRVIQQIQELIQTGFSIDESIAASAELGARYEWANDEMDAVADLQVIGGIAGNGKKDRGISSELFERNEMAEPMAVSRQLSHPDPYTGKPASLPGLETASSRALSLESLTNFEEDNRIGGELGRAELAKKLSRSRGSNKMNRPLDGLGGFEIPQRQQNAQSVWYSGSFESPSRWRRDNGQSIAWIKTFFPQLPTTPLDTPQAKQQKSPWPKEALAISKSLLRNDWLKEIERLQLDSTSDYYDPRWNRHTSHSELKTLYSKDAWLSTSSSPGNGRVINWYNKKERGVINEAFRAGQVRESVAAERMQSLPIGFHSFGNGLHVTYRDYKVEIEAKGNIRELLLTNLRNSNYQVRISVDIEKNVVVKFQSFQDNKLTTNRTYGEFVQIEGAWWAQKVESRDANNRVKSKSSTRLTLLNAADFTKRTADELQMRESSQLIKHPLPKIGDAETAALNGAADFEDRLVLIIRSARIQKWDDVLAQFEKLAELMGDKSLKNWIHLELLKTARRNAEAFELIQRLAEKLEDSQPGDLSLAQHLTNSAISISSWSETATVLQTLKPVYDRQPAICGASFTWRDHQIRVLRSLGRLREHLDLQKLQAEEQPWNVFHQTRYAQDLSLFGEHKKADQWLKSLTQSGRKYVDYEFDLIWEAWTDLLRSRGESAALVEVTEQWIATQSETQSAYTRHLSALTFDNRMKDGNALALKWMNDGQVAGLLTKPQQSKLLAGMEFALGRGWNLNWQYIDPIWLEPLQKTFLHFMEKQQQVDLAYKVMNPIIGQYQFAQSDNADLVRVRIFEKLKAEAPTLSAKRLQNFTRWARGGKPSRDASEWTPIIETMRQRWNKLKHTKDMNDEKAMIASTLTNLYLSYLRDSEYFAFLRAKIEKANKAYRDSYVRELFYALLREPWQEKNEVEAFSLLTELSKNDAIGQIGVQIGAVQELVDKMLEARYNAANQALQDTGHPEKLTRQELVAERKSFIEDAYKGLSDHLAKQVDGHDGLLKQWLVIERIYLDVRQNRQLKKVISECLAILGERPARPNNADRKLKGTARRKLLVEQAIKTAVQQRALMTFANLALRKSAKPELAQRLLEYIDAGIADSKADGAWKRLKYNVLIAMDKPRELDRELRKWIREDEYIVPWQRMLARLAAERGEVQKAINLFNEIEKDSQLTSGDYDELANWYLFVDQKADYKRAKIGAFKVIQENQLRSFVSGRRYVWERQGSTLPTELDERVLFAFQALLEKSASPGNYLYDLASFYKACRDFRLLQVVPDSLIGRTRGQVYNFLGRLRTTVLREIRKEATVDEMLARIEVLRMRDLTTLDRRALDLLEAQVERKAAEVLNQPGPHIVASLNALKRAFDREWESGEGRQMAEFLDSLGHIRHAELSAEQFRQLEELHRRETPGTDDRLWTGYFLANTKFSPYGQREAGLQRMEIVLREYEQTHPDGWPANANTPLSGYVQMFEQLNRHSDAEKVVQRHLENPLNTGQRNWLIERLTSVYVSALQADSRVSLGERAGLYKNLIPFILKQADGGDDNHRYQVLRRLNNVFGIAKKKNFPTLRKDMREHAFETLPRILKQQRNNYSQIISNFASQLRNLLGARIALEFLIDRSENYPARFHNTWERAWARFGYQFADLRRKVGDAGLGDLEPRLLVLTLNELRRDLITRNQYSRYLYRRNYHFWSSKEADFARVAEEVLKTRRKSPRSVVYIGRYFFDGLWHRQRAIEIMFEAHKEELLNDSAIATLVDWLHHRDVRRYAESIPLLEGLIARYDLSLHYRVELITAYYRSSRPEQGKKLYDETLALCRQSGRWTEYNISQLARCVHDLRLNQPTIDLLGELIPVHQRNHPTRGIGHGTLSTYYTWLADAHSALKQTAKAVDAAAGAIVSWGPRYSQRVTAVSKLDSVTLSAPDLPKFVATLNEKAKETGQDSAIIRRSIGQAFLKQKKFKLAIEQLKIAVELQPGDVETQKALISAYDSARDDKGAVRQLLSLIDIDRHNLEHYQSLERRLRDDEEQAERAATAVIEASPMEAEHHEVLARLRDIQERYREAVLHWRQVSQLRSLEPNGLIHLAQSQIRAGNTDAAKETITRLQKTDWPSRFETEVRDAVSRLNRQAP